MFKGNAIKVEFQRYIAIAAVMLLRRFCLIYMNNLHYIIHYDKQSIFQKYQDLTTDYLSTPFVNTLNT